MQTIPSDDQLPDDEEVAWIFKTEAEADASLRGHAELAIWAEKRLLRRPEGLRWCVVTKKETA